MPSITMNATINHAPREGWHKDAINWDIELSNGRHTFKTQYSEGIGHFISLPHGQRHTLDVEAVYNEIKSGKPFSVFGQKDYLYKHLTKRAPVKNGVAKITPPALEAVLSCLALDASALPLTFEDWCAEYGYETDSRQAFAIWEACCNTARQLYALGFSDDELQKLREEA